MSERFLDLSKGVVPAVLVVSLAGGVFFAGRWVGISDARDEQLTRIEHKIDESIKLMNYRHDLYMDHINALREALAREGIRVD